MAILNTDLLTKLKCQLMTIEEPFDSPDPHIEKTIEWAMIRDFDDKTPTKKEIIEKFEEKWVAYCKETDTTHSKGYWSGFKEARKPLHHLYELFRFYTVVRPVQTFSLVVEGHEITGKYGVIERRSSKGLPYVFVLRPSESQKQIPDAVDLTSWYSASRDYPNIGIWNFPFRSDGWKYKSLSEDITYDTLVGIVNALDHPYFVPGEHCKSCIGRKCMEIITE
jgi:hypothetical protein